MLALFLAAALLCTGVFAAGPSSSKKKTTPLYCARYAAACLIVDTANCEISALVRHAQATRYDDTALLIVETQLVASVADALVAALGFDTECEYVPYVVDGKTVMIDPLRVVDPTVPKD